MSWGARPVRLPTPTGFAAAVEASPWFHPLILGKAVGNLFVQGGRAGSVTRPEFQSSCSKSVSSAKTFGSSTPVNA